MGRQEHAGNEKRGTGNRERGTGNGWRRRYVPPHTNMYLSTQRQSSSIQHGAPVHLRRSTPLLQQRSNPRNRGSAIVERAVAQSQNKKKKKKKKKKETTTKTTRPTTQAHEKKEKKGLFD